MERFYAVLAWDNADSAAARTSAAADHLAHITRVSDRICIAGPLRDDDDKNVGSLLVVAADSSADAEALIRTDPYYAAGVWDRIEVRPFLAAAGTWVGGTTW
jgi:uncharacterized protein YciI